MNELLYALPPAWRRPDPEWGLTPVHMAYRITPALRLEGVGLHEGVRGGGMFLACPEEAAGADPLPCCRRVAEECRRRGFDRVVCDFECPPSPVLTRLAAALGEVCARSRLTLYLPEGFASAAPGCRVLVSSAMTSGSLARRLERAAAEYGRERVVLAVEAAAEDFTLPAAGRGAPLSAEELAALIRRVEPAVFFDRGLCAHYFTYMAPGGRAHFVLFDTPRSLRAKLDAAQNAAIPSALLAAPQVEGMVDELFGCGG